MIRVDDVDGSRSEPLLLKLCHNCIVNQNLLRHSGACTEPDLPASFVIVPQPMLMIVAQGGNIRQERVQLQRPGDNVGVDALVGHIRHRIIIGNTDKVGAVFALAHDSPVDIDPRGNSGLLPDERGFAFLNDDLHHRRSPADVDGGVGDGWRLKQAGANLYRIDPEDVQIGNAAEGENLALGEVTQSTDGDAVDVKGVGTEEQRQHEQKACHNQPAEDAPAYERTARYDLSGRALRVIRGCHVTAIDSGFAAGEWFACLCPSAGAAFAGTSRHEIVRSLLELSSVLCTFVVITPHPACVASLRQAVLLPFSPLAWEKGLGDEGCRVPHTL